MQQVGYGGGDDPGAPPQETLEQGTGPVHAGDPPQDHDKPVALDRAERLEIGGARRRAYLVDQALARAFHGGGRRLADQDDHGATPDPPPPARPGPPGLAR